ncbi:prolyl oligopeptidase family serine peptidase [Solimicrobium silvestre]|uniref:Serine proteases of the peptidase family S9A n=1 Tax=Solimicrobium silvestre TaxID=2099400 RepID=A0A2S9H3B9_9BURK|nr:prolyl oligopeptidase family serine peptidase [Solimicrobium silvestre]PRC94433.1 Serine proteases of the peptidase family S9A [Solimicrobium silvestre]
MKLNPPSIATLSVIVALLSAANLAHSTDQQNTADPYQWLEQVTDSKALDWVKGRNAITRAELEQEPDFLTLRSQIQAALDSKEKIPVIGKMGEYFYNFWQDGDHQRGVWRRTSLEEYRKEHPKWETVLDLDELAKTEKENWVFKGSACREPDYDRCLLQLSRGGADAVVVREFDLTSKQFVKGGFVLPEAKSNIEWRDKNSVFVATDFGAGSKTDSGYARIVKLWQRGTPLSQAQTLLEGKKTDISVSGSSSNHLGVHHEIIQRGVGFFDTEYYLYDDAKLDKLDVPGKAGISFFGSQFMVTLREPWVIKDVTYPAGALLAIDFDAYKKGARNFTTLFAPTERTSLTGATATKNYLLVEALDNVKSSMTEWKFVDGKWASRTVHLPTIGSIGVTALDDEHSDGYFLSYSDYLTPSTYMLAQAGNDEREVLKTAPAFFDASPYQTEQKQATSKDGTKVPYFIIHRKDMKLDGQNPTLLYGYGGFQISLTPSYSAGIGLGWLQKGGAYVVANIRGGGEFGPAWHEAAMKENRQKAYDDFAAVAQDLIATNVTNPKRLGTQGGSNGGLLAGVMLTQHPELFNAVISQVPLLDMQRFNKLLAGASWMGEYGNPDVPAEWAYISKYSPYQNVKTDVAYPNVLFITSTRDDRVHPGHARKMAAKMIEQGHKNVRYYENIEGGHGGAANNAQRADMNALQYTFMWKMLQATDSLHAVK